jgi:hypothetical protein
MRPQEEAEADEDHREREGPTLHEARRECRDREDHGHQSEHGS